MKTSSPWNFSSIVGKLIMGLVLAAMIGSIDVAPALAGDDHKHYKNHDNNKHHGKHDNKHHGKHDNKHHGKHDNRHYDNRGHGYDHPKPVYRPYGHYRPHGYREPVYYPPPPVIYEPPPPPGITIFLPPLFIGP